MRVAIASCMTVAALLCGCGNDTDSFAQAGANIEQNTKGAVHYVGTEKAPNGGYILEFKTSSPALMAKQNGDTDPTAFATNQRMARVWKLAGCTPEVKAAGVDQNAPSVVAKLTNENGDTQFAAFCL
jgi:hypothetical protein